MGYTLQLRVRVTEVYRDWINTLRDRAGRARIQVRVDRLSMAIRDSIVTSLPVSELKIDFGPG